MATLAGHGMRQASAAPVYVEFDSLRKQGAALLRGVAGRLAVLEPDSAPASAVRAGRCQGRQVPSKRIRQAAVLCPGRPGAALEAGLDFCFVHGNNKKNSRL